MNVRRVSLLLAAPLFVSCLDRRSGPIDEDEEEVSTGSCGVERWAIKTGSDLQAVISEAERLIGTTRNLP